MGSSDPEREFTACTKSKYPLVLVFNCFIPTPCIRNSVNSGPQSCLDPRGMVSTPRRNVRVVQLLRRERVELLFVCGLRLPFSGYSKYLLCDGILIYGATILSKRRSHVDSKRSQLALRLSLYLGP